MAKTMIRICYVFSLAFFSFNVFACNENTVPEFLIATSSSKIVIIGKVIGFEENDTYLSSSNPIIEVEDVIKGVIKHREIIVMPEISLCKEYHDVNLMLDSRYLLPISFMKYTHGDKYPRYLVEHSSFKLITKDTVCCIKGNSDVYSLNQIKEVIKQDLGYIPNLQLDNGRK